MKRPVIPFILSLIIMICGAVSQYALDPEKPIDFYLLDIWGLKEGLPQNSVLAILQTRDGYIWLGTQEGLVRFNGQQFFTFDRNNTSVLSGGFVRALLEDRQGTLWIGTQDGGVIHYKDGKFLKFDVANGLSSNKINTLLEHRDGSIWIGTRGGGVNIIQDHIVSQLDFPRTSAGNDILALLQDHEGNVWIGTNGEGLFKRETMRFRTYTQKDGLAGDHVTALFEDSKRNLWICTAAGGACVLKDGKFKTYGTADGLSTDRINAVFEDRRGNLWFGTHGGGLHRFVNGIFSTFNAQKGLSNDYILSIYEDREGSLWIGTDGGGLNRLKDGKFMVLDRDFGLSHDVVFPIFEASSGALYIGAEGAGLNCLKDGKITVYDTSHGLSNNNVFSIYEDKEGALWIGTYGGGVNCFMNGSFRIYTMADGLSSNYIRAISGDRSGAIWIGTDGGGLNRYENGKFTVLNGRNGLSHNRVTAILEDSSAALWVGTFGGGVNRISDGKITILDTSKGLSSLFITTIFEDSEGTIWVGTLGNGLNRYKNGVFKPCTVDNGLYDNLILCILEDDSGNLWMSCNRGIFRISVKELTDFYDGKTSAVNCVSFGKSDGMKSEECNGLYQPSGFKGKDGKLWFPTLKGAAAIDPSHIPLNSLAPPVYIEKVLVDLREQVMDPGKEIELPAGTGKIEIHFAALSFVSPERVKYRYILEGFDKKWTETAGRGLAFYTNLSPGTYSFRVIACNNDNLWNNTGATLRLTLRSYFYETLWFYILCVFGVIVLAFGGYRYRVRRMKRHEEQLGRLVNQRTEELKNANLELENLLESLRKAHETAERERAAAEAANRTKSEFLARMSHEIRTPMNSVIGFTEMLLGTELNEEQIDYAGTISRSGEALISILNDIMDLSKIEVGELSFEPVDFDPEAAAFEVCELIVPRIGDRDLEVLCRIGERIPPLVNQDPVRFRQVLINLMGNASKFTESGEIELSLDVEEALEDRLKLHAAVRDTGIGIPPHKIDTVFEAFQQADVYITRKYGGTGLGLSISRQMARLMGGDVRVESREGMGSIFHFTAWVDSVKKEAEPESISPESKKTTGRKVLIIEKTYRGLEILEDILGRYGMTAVKVKGGEDMLSTLQESIKTEASFDLGLLNIHAAGMDVYTLVSEIRELIPGLPMIAISYSTSKYSKKYRDAGFNGFLAKPVQGRKLLKAIETLLLNNGAGSGKESKGKRVLMSNNKNGSGAGADRSFNILLAEDNPVNQKLARFILTRAGHRLEVAENGREAVERYTSTPERFDLIFMDIQMPEMDGREAARIIRQKGYTTIPIIAMTAESMKGDREKCLEAGMNDYLSKPIKQEIVFDMIRRWAPPRSTGNDE